MTIKIPTRLELAIAALAVIVYLAMVFLSGCSSRKKDSYTTHVKTSTDSTVSSTLQRKDIDTGKVNTNVHLEQTDSSLDILTIYPHAGAPISFSFALPALNAGHGYHYHGLTDSIKHTGHFKNHSVQDRSVQEQKGKTVLINKQKHSALKKDANITTGENHVQRKGISLQVPLIIGLIVIALIAVVLLKRFKVFPFV